MPSCVARGCSTRYDRQDPNGSLKLFPRKDRERRQIWIDRVNRSDWLPTRFSGLCDKHFDRSQWESPRQDGKRKLKSSAVPTVFCVDPHCYQDIVSQEHAYCMQGYRQFYPEYNPSQESDDCEVKVKVEVEWEEDNNNTQVEWDGSEENRMEEMETVQIKEERLSDSEENSGSAEDIQCTPDIMLFNSNQPQLCPIEMVECNQEDNHVNLLEPSNDPLAISADDLEKSQKVPTFAHSRKFVFVTKDTKYKSSMQNVVRSEPLITTEKPMVKLIGKPPRLFKPKEVILYRNSSSDPTKLPTLQIAPNSAFRSILPKPQIPSSTIPLVNSICLPNKKLSPLKLKLISPTKQETVSLPDAEVVNSPTNSSSPNTNPRPTLKLSNIVRNVKLLPVPKLEPAPEFLRPKKILLKGSVKGINKFLSQNSSLKPIISNKLNTIKIPGPFSKQVSKQHLKDFLFGGKSNVSEEEKSVDPLKPNEEIAVEKKSTSDIKSVKLISSPLSNCDNQSEKSKVTSHRSIKVIPNQINNVGKLKNLASGKNSVIILKPVQKSPSNPQETVIMTRRSTNKTLYKCIICKIMFLTYTTLRLHMFSKHKTSDMSLSKFWQVMKTHGEPNFLKQWLKEIKESKKAGGGARKLVPLLPKLNEPDLNSFKTDKIEKQINIRKSQQSNSAPYSLPKKTSRLKEVVKSRKRRRNKKFAEESSEDIQEYNNDLLYIPNINALKKSDDEFIRLTKLVTGLGSEEGDSETHNSSVLDTSGKLSDDSSTISARDSLCKLSDDSSTLSAPETFGELAQRRSGNSKETNIRRPMNRKSQRELVAKQTTLISRVSKTRRSKNGSKKEQSSKNNATKSKTENDQVLAEEKKSSRLKSKVKEEDEEDTKRSRNKDIKSKNSNGQIQNEIGNKRKPFTQSIVTKNKTISPVANGKNKKICSDLKSKAKSQESLDFVCSTCSERFAKRSELRKHVSTGHKVVKCFVCPKRDCSRRFESRRDMVKHSRIHKK